MTRWARSPGTADVQDDSGDCALTVFSTQSLFYPKYSCPVASDNLQFMEYFMKDRAVGSGILGTFFVLPFCQD